MQQLLPFPTTSSQEIIQGDCAYVMKQFPDNHFTHVLTDPPYGLKFMGKKWDYGIPLQPVWEELLRVCKPGAMLLCFGGTRTYHRLACEIENAGWEIRDCLMWIYGQGFPKSNNKFGLDGYGTALKPAYEPILMAMKTLDGTFKQNAEKWGLGGINIDGSRIECESFSCNQSNSDKYNYSGNKYGSYTSNRDHKFQSNEKGRWPANILLDEEAAQILDAQSGILKSPGSGINRINNSHLSWKNSSKEIKPATFLAPDQGGASRFFYCAKASSAERGTENKHPTVKPIKLIEYLIKLISPPKNSLLLDPFLGSGTTLLAARNLGINAIGIEKEPEYCEIAKNRLAPI